MLALLQRVSKASVVVDDAEIALIGHGLLAFVCAVQGDTHQNAIRLADKIANVRIFSDQAGRMNKSVADVAGSCLVVSEFTLAANTDSGRRPYFGSAESGPVAKDLCLTVAAELRSKDLTVAEGIFGADMQVNLTNDGPVTIMLSTS